MIKILDKLLLFLNVFTFISAFAGSYYLITANENTIPHTLLKYSPFDSFIIPGLILGIAVGGTNLISALCFLMKSKYLSICETITGVILCGWISGELVLIRQFSWLQVIYFIIGLIIVLVSFKKTYATMVNL